MCRSRRELSNEYLLAKFGFGTAENEPSKVGSDPVSPDCGRDYVRYLAALLMQDTRLPAQAADELLALGIR